MRLQADFDFLVKTKVQRKGWLVREATWTQQPDYNLDGEQYEQIENDGDKTGNFKDRANVFKGNRPLMEQYGCETYTGSKEPHSDEWDDMQDDEIRCCYHYQYSTVAETGSPPSSTLGRCITDHAADFIVDPYESPLQPFQLLDQKLNDIFKEVHQKLREMLDDDLFESSKFDLNEMCGMAPPPSPPPSPPAPPSAPPCPSPPPPTPPPPQYSLKWAMKGQLTLGKCAASTGRRHRTRYLRRNCVRTCF